MDYKTPATYSDGADVVLLAGVEAALLEWFDDSIWARGAGGARDTLEEKYYVKIV